MKKHFSIFFIIFLFSTHINAQSSFDTLWKKVEKFELDNLPKSAVKEVTKIYKKAVKEKNSPQIIKTLFYKSKFSLILEEDAQLKIIHNFKKHIAQSTFPTKNVLENILANLYWQYFNQNRWKFYNRTKTSKKVDKTDFRTWDLNTLFNEIHKHYKASLTNGLLLQQTDIYEFQDILYLPKETKRLRPTLFDFLAHNALTFYKTSETDITKPAYQFKIDNPMLLGFADAFTKETIQSKDSLSLQLNALKVYQELITFHLKDHNYSALADVDLERLQFVKQHATFSDKEKTYLKTLLKSKNRYQNKAISGLYAFKIASIYEHQAEEYQPKINEKNRFKYQKALTICNQIIKNFPKSLGAEKCRHLKKKITNKWLQITAEKHLPIQQYSRVLINYKNIDQLFFTVYHISKREKRKLQKLYKDEDKIAFINQLTIAKKWISELKNENDYQKHTTEVIIPRLEQGNYLLVATTSHKITEKKMYGTTHLQVTDLAFVVHHENNNYTYQVVNRNTGKPLAGAKVTLSNKPYRRYSKKLHKHFVTNKNGEFTFSSPKKYYSNVKAIITYKKDVATFGSYYINSQRRYTNRNEKVNIKSFLFTDRSIYRPGQTVYFKGILMENFKKTSKILTDELVFATLYDVNQQKVKELELISNKFGSFSGKFTLPISGLTGNYHIEIHTNVIHRNDIYFSVEEYKRPKFKTEFKPITESYKINDSVTVNGFSKAFSGANITEAKVVYRVHRKVQYSRWWYWYKPQNSSESQEITHGKTITDANGNYQITFKALADESISKDNLPVFNYEITADVTDVNGETHSATTIVKVGYHSLLADISIADKLNKNSKKQTITINTTNLNGEFVSAKGALKIYKLTPPKYPLRKRPWKAPDYQVITKDDFQQKFPHDAYNNEDNFMFWKKKALVFATIFNTKKSKEVILKRIKKWRSGKYIIELVTQDKFGQKVTDKQFFTVFSKKDKLPADNQLFTITTGKKDYKIGETVKVTLSSNSKDITIRLSVEKQHKIVATYFVHLNENSQQINIPVTKEDEGGFAIKYHLVNYNDYINGYQIIKVPYPKTDLEIITKTFRDKLQPGSNQTWSFTIKGAKKDKVLAEVLASMYDASLDQFKPHNWQFNPIYKPHYYTNNQSNAYQSFSNTNFRIKNMHRYVGSVHPYSYTQFNWFGFGFSNRYTAQKNYLRKIGFKPSLIKKSGTFNGTVTGIIEDGTGFLPGVNILIKGTTKGTTTDFDGNFSIKVKKNDVLIFSYLGYKAIKIKVTDFSTLYVRMEENGAVLDEVVVTGLGIKREKKSLGYSVTSALSGKVAGVQITEADGTSGAGNKIIIRGMSSINKEKQLTFIKKTAAKIQIRKNFNETAFFYPHLTTNKKGEVSFNFTIPEALTQWKLQLVAHTKELHSATKTLTTVTQKELMIVPNTPRFLREEDKIIITAKISNLTSKKLSGIAKLSFVNPLNGKDISLELLNTSEEKKQMKINNFTVDKKGNTSVSWQIQVPKKYQAIQYKITAKSGNFSDGEQNILPVLSNRILVTETLPMWIRSNETKTFSLDKLANYKPQTSTTLSHHKLSLEMTSNPAWYAVQALPYLMEYPYECAEQTFARYYANTLASFVANSNPKIQEVFNSWKSSDALLSNLEKNKELKSLIIQETPWLRDAQSETEQKKRIALLFDLNRMRNEQESTINKLYQMQLPNGGFPWFKGSDYPNQYITLHIASGFGHLERLGASTFNEKLQKIIQKSVFFLDDVIANRYQQLLKEARKIKHRAKTKTKGKLAAQKFLASNHLGYFELHYLYMRSFYTDIAVPKKTQKALTYYTQQSATFWKDFNLYGKGQIALIQFRTGDKKVATKIVKSLKENSITSDELGMYWKSNTASYYFYQAPIETQALLIEVFTEVGVIPTEPESATRNLKDIDNLKIWLLKNKQTNRWKTTKATTEAVYALLLQESDWISITDMVNIKVGDTTINPAKIDDVKVEAGTGYFKTSWNGTDIKPNMGKVTITKKGKGIAWGALYWQYFENLDKITSAKSPLQLHKKLFLKTNSDSGKILTEITDNTSTSFSTRLKVGDLITVRIEIHSDRDMEFIHLKDMRASGVEPINVLSRYKWQDGLGYYESTKDAATNFFFDRLPKGVYVFEYDVRVNNAGDFSNGISTLQSMYAPEFSSHSKGVRIKVKSK